MTRAAPSSLPSQKVAAVTGRGAGISSTSYEKSLSPEHASAAHTSPLNRDSSGLSCFERLLKNQAGLVPQPENCLRGGRVCREPRGTRHFCRSDALSEARARPSPKLRSSPQLGRSPESGFLGDSAVSVPLSGRLPGQASRPGVGHAPQQRAEHGANGH